MATRRNRIVVKPNLKPSVSKPGVAPKSKPSAPLVQIPVEPVAASGKSATLPGHKDTTSTVSSTNDGEKTTKNNNVISVDTQNLEFSGGKDGTVKKRLSTFLKKSVTPDVYKEPGNESDKDDGITERDKETDKRTVTNLSVEADHSGPDKFVKKSQAKIDDGTNDDEASTQPSLTSRNLSGTTSSTETKNLVPSLSKSTPTEAISVTEIEVDSTDGGIQQKEKLEGDKDTVDQEVLNKKGIEVTEEETPQQPKRKRKREKKERKEPLPPSDKSPDRLKMKMSDLIVWNPSQNYFPKKKKSSAPAVKKEDRPVTPESVSLDDDESSNQSTSLPAPQVMIGPDGNIVINTQSLIIETPKEDTEVKAIIEEDDDDRYLNSNSYRKTTKTKLWTEMENEKFFMGLSMCGTDFSLMCKLLPKRTRRELKNKFRREEKRNRPLIDKALATRQPYDVSPFEKMAAEETAKLKEAAELKIQSKRKLKQEALERRQKKIKKEKDRRLITRKSQESEDEEDDWGEPEYDDDNEDKLIIEEDEKIEIDDETINSQESTPWVKKSTAGKKKTASIPAPSSVPKGRGYVAVENIDEPFIPPSVSASITNDPVYEEIVVDMESTISGHQQQERVTQHQMSRTHPASNGSQVHSQGNSATVSDVRTATNVVDGAVRQTSTDNRNIGSNILRISSSLRSIPGSAPIQIEMEGVTTPMQGVLIPSHMVPQLAPQLGIPPSSTPMQVLLVQEEANAGSMVHVYVIPEKESNAAQFAQSGQGRVAANESGQGLTLTSPIPSPRPVRRPSTSSTPNPTSPYPAHSNTASSPHVPSDTETSLSTIRNVYGSVMNSLSSNAATACQQDRASGASINHSVMDNTHLPSPSQANISHSYGHVTPPSSGQLTVINRPNLSSDLSGNSSGVMSGLSSVIRHHSPTGSSPHQFKQHNFMSVSHSTSALPQHNLMSVLQTTSSLPQHTTRHRPPSLSSSSDQLYVMNSSNSIQHQQQKHPYIQKQQIVPVNREHSSSLSSSTINSSYNNSPENHNITSVITQSAFPIESQNRQNIIAPSDVTSTNEIITTATLATEIDTSQQEEDCMIVNSNNPQSQVEKIL